jgi:DNA repair protein RadA/Sms
MDKICGFRLSGHDIFINVAGGMKVDEPAVDLGIVASMASSFLDRPIDAGTVVFGEVGLTGEVRGISQMDMRIKEAARMGFKRCIIPQTPFRNDSLEKKVEFIKVSNLKKLLEYLF